MSLTTKQMRFYMRRRRASRPTHQIYVELSTKQYRFFSKAWKHSKDPIHKFKAYSILTGAVFRANAGQANGDKIQLPKGLLK